MKSKSPLLHGTFNYRYSLWYVKKKDGKRSDAITYTYKGSRNLLYRKGKESNRWKEIQHIEQEFWGKNRCRINITDKEITNVKQISLGGKDNESKS